MDGELKKRARRRALRAAQVVTIALAMGTGCSTNDGPPTETDAAMMDTAVVDASGGEDTGVDDAGEMSDAGMNDAGDEDAGADDAGTDAMADAGEMDSGEPDATIADAGADVFDAGRPCSFPPTTIECCTDDFCSASGSACFWDDESGMCLVAVPGPFVPPAMA